MADVTDLLTSTTPDVDTLPDIDIDGLVRTGTRRRVAKRASAAVLGLALVAGGGPLLVDVFTAPDVPFVTDLPGDATWESLPDAPFDARSYASAYELVDGRVVVAGGMIPSSDAGVTLTSDAAVLSADRSTWTSVPLVPFGGADRGVEFTVRGTTLWSRTVVPMLLGSRFDEGLELARIDLNALEDGWDVIDPLSITGLPEVTILDDSIVVYAGADGSSATRFAPMDTSGAVWRDGVWTSFDAAPLEAMTGPFVAVSDEHLAFVGGLRTDGTTTAGAAVLDLETLVWRVAPDHPLGPRSSLGVEVDALIADGRMFVAGGIALRGSTCGSQTDPCNVSGSAVSSDPCVVEIDECVDVAETQGGSASQAASVTVPPVRDEMATGAAWLDLSSLSWETVDLDMAESLPRGVRTDSLSAPHAVEVLTFDGEQASTVLRDGTVVHHTYDGIPFPATRIDMDVDGPVLATTERIGRRPARRAALPVSGGWTEVTVPGDLEGVTYLRVGDGLLAIGGVPYEAGRDSNDELTGSIESYNLDGPFEVRFLPWRW